MAANARVQQGNFTLSGLRGFEVRGKTIGIIGTGAGKAAFLRIEHQICCHDRSCRRRPVCMYAASFSDATPYCRRHWHGSRQNLEGFWDTGARL